MALLRGVGRTVGGLASTLALGGFVGFVATAMITPFLPGPVQPGDRHEPPVTRQYVLALLARDPATLTRLTIPQNPVQKASVWEEMLGADAVQLDTLTYLGGADNELFGSHVYAIGARTADDVYHLAPVSVTLRGDRVFYIRGSFEALAPSGPIAAPSPSASAPGGASPSASAAS